MSRETVGKTMIVNGQPLPLSKAVKASGTFVFASGQLPLENGKLVGDDIETQTKQVLDNVAAVLKEAGAALSDVVKCTIWITDPADFAAMNGVYRTYFSDAPPARSCVVSGLVVAGAKVEIEAIAVLPA